VAEEGEALAPGTVYLAGDDRHLGVSEHSTILYSSADPVGGFRPSGTFLFESAAKSYGYSTLALVLTGMGNDGVAGLKKIRDAGGWIIAQDKKSSVVYGMPAEAIKSGHTDWVMPLDEIAARLMEMIPSEVKR
jgi:two-component system chemotaxis response regulator CheB